MLRFCFPVVFWTVVKPKMDELLVSKGEQYNAKTDVMSAVSVYCMFDKVELTQKMSPGRKPLLRRLVGLAYIGMWNNRQA